MAALLAHDFTPRHIPMTLGDKLQRLAELSPKHLHAIEVLADLALAELAQKMLTPDRTSS